MKYWFFIITLSVLSNWAATEKINPKLLLKIFESKEFSLNQNQLEEIQKLLENIQAASTQELTAAARVIHKNLKEKIFDLRRIIQKNKEQRKPTSFETWRTLHLLSAQKEHFEQFIKKHETIFGNVSFWFYQTFPGIFAHNKIVTDAQNLAEEILHYVQLERENILFSYPAVIAYLSSQKIKHKKLPEIIRFWEDRKHRNRLLYDVKQMAPKAQIQSFIVDLIVQMAIMSGESMYEGWVSQEDAEYYKQLAAQEQLIQNDFSSFEKNLAEQQQKNITAIVEQFKSTTSELDQQRKKSETLFSNEVNYLNKLYDDSPPKNLYVVYAIDFDQAFEVSPMHTPPGYTWYNVYPQPNQVLVTARETAGKDVVTTSDWEYDSDTDQFSQYNLVPFQASKEIQDAVTQMLPANYLPDTGQYAHNNNIFCEYITGAQSYYIDVDLTIIGAEYPFFAGIMFNKARWISGVVERIEQYRLFGLFGTSDEQGSKKINIGFAQYQYIPAKDKESKPTITPPLEQITDPKYQPLATLDETLINKIGKNPITFTINILTQPTASTLSMSTTDSQGNKIYLFQDVSITDLDPMIYIYHGIGFMAPGCQASFKINKPAELTYSQEARDDFKNFIANEVNKALRK